MSHVAEGELHAWLDGALAHEAGEEAERIAAHLRRCGDCRARLEEARALRERAERLLGAAAPTEDLMPEFEAIERRAAAAEEGQAEPAPARRRGTPGPLRTLAWAASLLLGVGLGWAARAAWQPGGSAGTVALAERSPAAVRASPSTEGRTSAAPGERAARTTEDLEGRTEPTEPTAADALAARRGVGRSETAAADADATGRVEGVADVPLAQTLFRAERPASEADRDAGPEEVWIATTPEDAARWLGGRLLVVEGLPLVDVAVSTAEGARVARARQRLPSGDLLELLERPVSAGSHRDEAETTELLDEVAATRERAVTGEPAAARKAAPASPELAIVPAEAFASVAELDVRIRAPVAPDSLRVLLSSLRPREP